MHIWLDDIVPPPVWNIPSSVGRTVWVRSWAELEFVLSNLKTNPKSMSFDHDLGETIDDGYTIMRKYQDEFPYLYPLETMIHSMNQVGARNLYILDNVFRKNVLKKRQEAYWISNRYTFDFTK